MAFADAKQPRPVEDPFALVAFGWAPGEYHRTACSDCGQSHSGTDKRSRRCQDCAEKLRDNPPPPSAPMTAVDHAELKRVADELVQMLAPDQGESAHPAFGHAVRIQNAHAALLSEIERMKAERDRLMRASNKDNAIIKRLSERKARTQAPDSWRPEVSDDDLAVLSQIIHSEYYYGADSMGEALRRIYIALRPQRAESGK